MKKGIMKNNLISKERANKIYDILVKFGNANEIARDDFLYHHCESPHGCSQWAFGNYKFSAKYYSENNFARLYYEDVEPENLTRIEQINAELKKLDENNNMQMSTMQSNKEANEKEKSDSNLPSKSKKKFCKTLLAYFKR